MLRIEDLQEELKEDFVDDIQDVIDREEDYAYFSDLISETINSVIPYNNGKINDDLIVQYLDIDDPEFLYKDIREELMEEISSILDNGYELDNEDLNTLNKYNSLNLYDVFEGGYDYNDLSDEDIAVVVVIVYDSLSDEMQHSVDVLTNTAVYQSLDDYLFDVFEDMGIEDVDIEIKEVKEMLSDKTLDDLIKNVDVKDTSSKVIERDELEL